MEKIILKTKKFPSKNGEALELKETAKKIILWLNAQEKLLNLKGKTIEDHLVFLEQTGGDYGQDCRASVSVKIGNKTENKETAFYFTDFCKPNQHFTSASGIASSALGYLSKEEALLKKEGKKIVGYSVTAFDVPEMYVGRGGAFIKIQ